jgi:hypothetical protein
VHALVTRLAGRALSGLPRTAAVGLLLLLVLPAPGCKERVTRTQCDELLGRFAELVVKEKLPDAGLDTVRAEQAREREEAARDDSFKNCTTELRLEEYRCAMAAKTAEALLKCLE